MRKTSMFFLASIVVASVFGSFAFGQTLPSCGSGVATISTVQNLEDAINGVAVPSEHAVAAGEITVLMVTGISVASASATTTPLPTNLGGLEILFEGVPSAMLSVAPAAGNMTQVVFQVPLDISGPEPFGTTGFPALQVVNGSCLGPVDQVTLESLQPGFVRDDHGNTVIQPNADGSMLTVYAVGLGLLDLAPAIGVPVMSPDFMETPVALTIDGQIEATLWYAGATPGVIGLYQINFTTLGSLDLSVPHAVSVQAVAVKPSKRK